jgi:5-methyltetrahydrofolate corrinoid/iron sulfur protein methyltransferase
MTFLVRTVQECVDLPIVLDTANPRAVAAGLAASRDTGNNQRRFLAPEKLERILPMARQHDCDIIGYLLRPNGHVPVDASGRMEAAVALFDANVSKPASSRNESSSTRSWLPWPGRTATARTWPCWK